MSSIADQTDLLTPVSKEYQGLIQKLPKHLAGSLLTLERAGYDSASMTIIDLILTLYTSTDEEWEDKLAVLSQIHHHDNVSREVHDFLLYFSSLRPLAYFPESETNMPSEYRIVTAEQHCFDVRELLNSPQITNGCLINPLNGTPFHPIDQRRIFDMARIREIEVDLPFATVPQSSMASRAGLNYDLYQVVKAKSGDVVPFSDHPIDNSIRAAYVDVHPDLAMQVSQLQEKVERAAYAVSAKIRDKYPNGGIVHSESIQDYIESALSECGDHDVARSYVLFREERLRVRYETQSNYEPCIRVKLPNGQLKELDKEGLRSFLQGLASGLDNIEAELIVADAYRNLFDQVTYKQVNEVMIMSCRSFIEREANYSFMASRLLRHRLCEEAVSYYEGKTTQLKKGGFDYSYLLGLFITKGAQLSLINPKLSELFDFAALSKAIDCMRDEKLTYMSVQTLYDRYLIHDNEERIELPQLMFMRVAMGLSLKEKNPTKAAIDYYNTISELRYMPSTPTLFNAGTMHPQLSSCFLTSISDDLHGIMTSVLQNGMLSKWAGGLGNSWTRVRSNGAKIVGTNGKSSGIVPFMKIMDSCAIAVNQGGKRQGAVCGYLETWHVDILDFLDLRKNTGDDRRRTHDMHTANWVPDLFMKRVRSKEMWTMFSPNDVPDLHEISGPEFEKAYADYEQRAVNGEFAYKQMPALDLWRKMLSMLFETGHPWMTFKDPCNLRNPQKHQGVVHSSNLCTEITLNTSDDEVAVCNLGSLCIPHHMDSHGVLDEKKLANTIYAAVRMLDNVLDINYYALDEAERSNRLHRPIGLGLMGFQDALYRKKLPYESKEAVEFADELMEFISFHAISASIQLAKERGVYPSYKGSLWSQGVLPIDSIKYLRENRTEETLFMDQHCRLDWEPVRSALKAYGIRNSNVMAIAPTATISNIVNVSQSIEPCYMNLQVKSNLSGEFTVINTYLINALKERGLWDDQMCHDLKLNNGSIQDIRRVPDDIKAVFCTAFEIKPETLIDAAARRQKWIDQAQSLNLYMAKPSGRKLHDLYMHAWRAGLKTTYYLRSLGATTAEKSTLTDGALNQVSVQSGAKICSIDDPGCEACQ